MAHIKTLKNNELIGGQDNSDVYPITSSQAIFRQNPDGSIPEGIPHYRLEESLQDHEAQLTRLNNMITAIDDEPTLGSDNLVKSGGINESLTYICKKLNIKEVDITYYPDGYIKKTDGTVVSQLGWGYYSDFIELTNEYIILNCVFTGLAAGIAFYSSNSEDSFIIGMGKEVFSTQKDYLIKVPNGANYVRVCYITHLSMYNIADLSDIINTINIQGAEITKVSDSVHSITEAIGRYDWVDYGNVYTNVGWIVYTTGAQTTATNGRCTDFMAIADGATKIKRNGSSANTSGTAFYDENKNYISGVQAVEGESIINIPSNAKYVRSSTEVSSVDSSKLYYYGYTYTKVSQAMDTVVNDFPQIKDDIESLKMNFVGKYNSFSPNVQWTEQGYGIRYSDGKKFSINNDWQCTDFIAIPEGSMVLEIYAKDGNTAGTAFYSAASEDAYISGYKPDVDLKKVFIPNGAKYFRSSNRVDMQNPYAKYALFDDNFSAEFKALIEKVFNQGLILAGSSSIQRMCGITGDFALSTLLPNKSLYNYGVGGENIKAITARIGSEALLVASDVTIPSDTSSVTIAFTCRGETLTFSTQRGNKLPALNPVTIDGVKGEIKYVTDHYEFTRLEAGDSVSVKAGDICIPYAVNLRDMVCISALGYNGGYNDANDYMLYHKRVISHLISRRYLFMGILVVNGQWANPTNQQLQIEGLMEAEYGTNYWNIRKWLARQGIAYGVNLGILDGSVYPTAQDIIDMGNDVVPTSLRGDSAHLTDDGYKIMNYRLSEILKELGYVVQS